jgi:hypothetical protein
MMPGERFIPGGIETVVVGRAVQTMNEASQIALLCVKALGGALYKLGSDHYCAAMPYDNVWRTAVGSNLVRLIQALADPTTADAAITKRKTFADGKAAICEIERYLIDPTIDHMLIKGDPGTEPNAAA